jgi:hypothetical protein
MTDTRETVKKMARALIDNKGYPYAAGYLESYLVSIIEKYVTDPKEVTMLKMEMLNIAIDNKLDKIGA